MPIQPDLQARPKPTARWGTVWILYRQQLNTKNYSSVRVYGRSHSWYGSFNLYYSLLVVHVLACCACVAMCVPRKGTALPTPAPNKERGAVGPVHGRRHRLGPGQQQLRLRADPAARLLQALQLLQLGAPAQHICLGSLTWYFTLRVNGFGFADGFADSYSWGRPA
jgi:hypothetical protein